ncbi:MAG: O-antigen ligase family protein [Hahellaceae bacterium]|nr:O-antigen ligase family protein [Hahellaceae bacterium]MCP5210249.1 O-antigen ligase family protein [Hahellaceae bacterium]
MAEQTKTRLPYVFDLNLGSSMANIALPVIASLLLCSTLWVLPQPLILLFIPLLIPATLAVFRFPVWVCLGFILFSFFRLHEAIPVLNPLKIPQLLALASFTVLGWHIFISNQIKIYWSRQLSLFAIFFIMVCVGAVFATDRAAAFANIKDTYIKIAIMVCAIAWLIRRPADFSLASALIILAGIIIGCIAISNKLNGIGLVEGTRVTIGRDIGSMIGDPNDLALVLTFPLSFAASMLFTSKNSVAKRLLATLAYATIAWAIICTQSRGGLLGLTAVTGVLMWCSIKNKAIVIGIGSLIFVILIAVAGISNRASGGANEDGIDESAMGRIYAWQAAISMATHHPITGVGINNFYANYFFHSPHWDGKNHAVHSTWFQILAETGFVGLSLFISLLVGAFKLALRSLRRIDLATHLDSSLKVMARALLSGLVGFCVSGTFLTQGFIWPLYILMALTIALDHYLNSLNLSHDGQAIKDSGMNPAT